jgi:hypothetical protein
MQSAAKDALSAGCAHNHTTNRTATPHTATSHNQFHNHSKSNTQPPLHTATSHKSNSQPLPHNPSCKWCCYATQQPVHKPPNTMNSYLHNHYNHLQPNTQLTLHVPISQPTSLTNHPTTHADARRPSGASSSSCYNHPTQHTATPHS